MSNSSSNQFPAAALAQGRVFRSDEHELVIRQKPAHAKVFIGKEKDRKPIDPPPIIQLRISESVDPSQNYLQSPYYFISCSLLESEDDPRPQTERDEIKNALAGTLVSSLHRLKDTDNNDGGFFVFGDLSVKMEGFFKLQFTLYEVRAKEVEYIKSIVSEAFQVHPAKNWPGMAESTFLTRSFSDQGVRLRLRKEPRFRLGPRGPASDDYQPRHYNIKNPRRQGQVDALMAAQQPQALFSSSQETFGGRANQNDYLGPIQHHQSSEPQNSTIHTHQRKRDYNSQSDGSGSYGSHSDETANKRGRTDSDHLQQQSYGTQQQYTMQSAQYSGRQYPESSQTAQFNTYASHQLYGGSYTQSPQSLQSRDQGSFFTPRRLDTHFSAPSPYDSPGARANANSAQFQRSPVASSTYQYGSSLQPSYSLQQLQPQAQFVPELTQPLPPNRGALGMSIYNQTDLDQASLPPRPTSILSSDMPPPMYGRTVSMGLPQVGMTQLPLPTGGEDNKYTKSWGPGAFDYKPRDDKLHSR